MYPVFLTISLLLVAGSSVYMSVYGLMSVFVNQGRIILCMGLGMEIGKILVVSYLYRNWQGLGWLSRVFYSLIVFVLVLLTSIEVMGFLSQSHVHATYDLRSAETKLESLKREASILRDQISVIDTTLAGLPKSYVSRRIKERKAAGYNEKQARLLEIAKHEAELQAKKIKEQQSAGPIFAVARIMNIQDRDGIAALIILLVMVLEPLSVGLTIATTAAWMRVKRKPKEKPQPDTSTEELISLQRKYKLTLFQIVSITGRKKKKTCEAWLNGTTPVPERALRALRAWAKGRNPELTTDIKIKSLRDFI